MTEFLITVEHPELQSYAPRGWVHLANYGHAWQLVAVEAQVSCGKDEAPLAWAMLEILNGSDTEETLGIYTGPLPEGFLDVVTSLTDGHNVYLPLVAQGDMGAVPAAPEDHP